MEIETARAREIGLYQTAYEDPHYRMGVARRRDVERLLAGLPAGSLLDVGTGRGETLDLATVAGLGPVHGTDVVPALLNERVTYAELHRLPFEDGAFDHVTCFDVLEHLVPADTESALAELYRVARVTVTASASELPSTWHGMGGVDLHPNRRPAAEWERLIMAAWGARALRCGSAGQSPCWQVQKV